MLKINALDEISRISGIEIPQDLWIEAAEKRKEVLQAIYGNIVDQFASFQYYNSPHISMVSQLWFMQIVHLSLVHTRCLNAARDC